MKSQESRSKTEEEPDTDWYSTSMHLSFVVGAWCLTLALLW
jgi:hypothetical protein